jgi:hypothetical protein
VTTPGTTGGTAFPAARLDRPTRLLTAALLVALFGLALSIPVSETGLLGPLIGWTVPVAVIVFGYGLGPRSYVLSPGGELRIRRRWFGGRGFHISTAEATSALFGLGGIRLWGSGGAFGWYGSFWRKGTGKYRAYVTDRNRLVSCDGPDGLIVLSPADPEAFLVASRALLVPGGSAGDRDTRAAGPRS